MLPLAMILNEAITNAIKHAFSGDKPGQIQLALLHLLSGEVQLTIRDNGIGLYTMEDDAGVVVTIRFRPRGALLAQATN